MMKLKEILYKENLSRDDLIYLFNISEMYELDQLFERADEVRRENCGDDVVLRGLIEFSNLRSQGSHDDEPQSLLIM